MSLTQTIQYAMIAAVAYGRIRLLQDEQATASLTVDSAFSSVTDYMVNLENKIAETESAMALTNVALQDNLTKLSKTEGVIADYQSEIEQHENYILDIFRKQVKEDFFWVNEIEINPPNHDNDDGLKYVVK